jgi:hypothetical protein
MKLLLIDELGFLKNLCDFLLLIRIAIGYIGY